MKLKTFVLPLFTSLLTVVSFVDRSFADSKLRYHCEEVCPPTHNYDFPVGLVNEGVQIDIFENGRGKATISYGTFAPAANDIGAADVTKSYLEESDPNMIAFEFRGEHARENAGHPEYFPFKGKLIINSATVGDSSRVNESILELTIKKSKFSTFTSRLRMSCTNSKFFTNSEQESLKRACVRQTAVPSQAESDESSVKTQIARSASLSQRPAIQARISITAE